MKELSIEEKAKAYDKAIELICNCETDKYGCIIGVKPSDLFHELKESEDEKMRNAAINACKYMVDNFENSTKQYEDAIAWLEKQGEQNPAWSEEDENDLGGALWAIQQAKTIAKDENDMGNLWYAEHWFNSLKDRYAWKPSDEIMKGLNEIINKLAISPVIHEHGYLYDLMVNLRKKLKG